MTPVSRVAPVMVSGVTVENTTLHNKGEVERLEITVGDRVRVVRRGDVIPKIVEVMGPASVSDLAGRRHSDGTEFEEGLPERRAVSVPEECPRCSTRLIEEGAFIRCTNFDCPSRLERTILYWCRHLEMDGIGEKLAEQLSSTGLVRTLADLYKLSHSDIAGLERMAERSASNVIDELEATRSMTLSTFIAALGLPRIGPEIASVIAAEVGSLEALLELVEKKDDDPGTDDDGKPNKHNAAIGRLITIDGVYTRSNIVAELVEELDITEESPKPDSGPLSGQTFCITGTLSRPRKEVALSIKAEGGKVVSSVSGNLDYLVAGESAGSKLEKAGRLGVEVLTEAEIAEMTGMEPPAARQSSLEDY